MNKVIVQLEERAKMYRIRPDIGVSWGEFAEVIELFLEALKPEKKIKGFKNEKN